MASTVSQNYKNALSSNRRGRWRVELKLNNQLIKCPIQKLKLDESILKENKFTIGSATSSILYITLKNTENLIFTNQSIAFSIILDSEDANGEVFSEEINFQNFYITEVEENKESKVVEITAMDGIIKTNIPFVSALTYPNTLENVSKEFARKCGLSFEEDAIFDDIIINSELNVKTVREAFEILAQLQGANLVMNRNSKLEYRYFEKTDLEIDAGKTYTNAKLNDILSYVYSISMSNGSGIFEARGESQSGNNAIKLQLNNDYANKTIVESILSKNSITYRPANFSFIGDPSVAVGDIITLIDKYNVKHQIPIMKNTLEFDGGVKNTVEAFSESEEAQEFTQSKGSETLDKSTILAEAFKAAKGLLDEWATTGNVIRTPNEIIIGDSDTIETSMKLWRWNLGGLMHYSHGIDGPADDAGIAITMDGHINGKYLTVNSISAEAISTEYKQSVKDGIDNALNAAQEAKEQIFTKSTEIINTCEQIFMSALEEYVETDVYNEFKETVETQFKLLADELAISFRETQEKTTEVDGELKELIETLEKHFIFDLGNGLVIKAKDGDMELRLDNDTISFCKNGQQFGWWDGVDFHTGNIVIDVSEKAQFGDYAFTPRKDGSLSFSKII